MLQKFLTF